MIKNYFYNALFQILRIVLPVITMPYVARVLSADGVGAYSLSAAWANYFMILGMIGIDSYGCREIAYVRANKEEKRKIFWEINSLKSIAVLTSIIIYSVLIFAIIKPQNSILYIIQLLNLLSTFFDVSWYFAGIENFKSTAVRNIIIKIVTTIAIFAFVENESHVWVYTLILCLGQLVGQLVLWKEIIHQLFPIYIPKLDVIFFHLKKTILLWIPSLAASIYNYLDKVMLGTFTTDYQVGIYDYAQNIVKIPATLIFTIATITMPHAATDFKESNTEAAKTVFYKSMRIVTMLAFPMCLGLVAISDNFVSFFLGAEYTEVGTLMKISTWVVLPISWSQIVGSQLIIARSKEKFYSISICCGAVVNICLNLLLVKQYMSKGVLIASIVAEIVVLVVMLIFSRKDYSFVKAFKYVPKYFVLSIIMYVMIFVLTKFIGFDSVMLTIIQILIGMTTFVFLLVLTRDKMLGEAMALVKSRLLKK